MFIYADQPVVTTLGLTIEPAVAQNNAPEGQNSAVNFVSGVSGPKQSCINLLILLLLIFTIVLY